MIEVTLKKDNHTEWVEETQEDGNAKRVAKIFNKGDQVIVANGTYEAFKDRMEAVGPGVTPSPLVSRSTSLAQELASLSEEERSTILMEAGFIARISPEEDENPKLAQSTETKPTAEKTGAKRPAKKVGAKI